jgi:hypothetical protein
LLQQILDGTVAQHGVLLLQLDPEEDEAGNVTPAGDDLLDQQVNVVGRAGDDNLNAWGTYRQAVTISFRYETELSTGSHLGAEFTPDAQGSSPISLGKLSTFKDEYKSQRFSEMKALRSRASGLVTLAGVVRANTDLAIDARRDSMLTQLRALRSGINNKSGVLRFGTGASTAFNQSVKVDSFTADIDQANDWSIRWQMTASYTVFPSETGYAEAAYKAGVAEDNESGESVLTMSGAIRAGTEALALAKLALIRATCATYGFTSAQRTKAEVQRSIVNADDGTDLMQLDFADQYSKRGTILSHSLSISVQDDVRSAIRTKTYSGWVVSAGSDADTAYAAAEAKARDLGDNKLPMRLSGSIARTDRKTGVAAAEHMRVEFSFSYAYAGERLYSEYTTEAADSSFSESQDNVSGYVVGATAEACRAFYSDLKGGTEFAGRLITEESTSVPTVHIETGTYSNNGTFTGSAGHANLNVRLDFRFAVHRAKPNEFLSFRYRIRVGNDLVRLTKSTSVEGFVLASDAAMAAVIAGTAGNALAVLLAALNTGGALGTLQSTETSYGAMQVGSDADVKTVTRVEFAANYLAPLTATQQILACELQESTQYSGKRWVIHPAAGGRSVPQSTGWQHGQRTLSGTITAATEASALAKVAELLDFPLLNEGTGSGVTPTVRYTEPPQLSRRWVTLPLVEMEYEGREVNASFIEVSFSQSETLIDYDWRVV